jgi:LmbE family N-acetylglucosaminyl deacetylase
MDDEVLGCGGVISKHVKNGDNVWVVFIAHRIYRHNYDEGLNNREIQHAFEAKNVLAYHEAVFLNLNDERLDHCLQEIIIPLEVAVEKIRPKCVYLPFRGDNNQDHRAVFDASRVVLRPVATPYITDIILYEVPSSTEQSPPLAENVFMPNLYADITEHMEIKLKALRCYQTEARQYPHPRSEEALVIHAKKRGIEIGFGCSEAFMIMRRKWH